MPVYPPKYSKRFYILYTTSHTGTIEFMPITPERHVHMFLIDSMYYVSFDLSLTHYYKSTLY